MAETFHTYTNGSRMKIQTTDENDIELLVWPFVIAKPARVAAN
jgi:hypothetical protein